MATIAPGAQVYTPHAHTGRCPRWSRCDGGQTSTVVRVVNTYADCVTACGLLQVLRAADLELVRDGERDEDYVTPADVLDDRPPTAAELAGTLPQFETADEWHDWEMRPAVLPHGVIEGEAKAAIEVGRPMPQVSA